ncbi:MAG TPA: sigma factor [Candidatus Dormibacteraeota bacterium]|nr:sigma factor [Candidatus Dormibacteraeota bacterium]
MHGTLFSHSEAELIQAARRGDGAAFAELLRPHYQSAFRVAYGLLHDSTEAEDAVQEAAFKAWRRLGNLREGSSLRPWFLAIVANQCRGTSQSKWWSVAKGGIVEGEEKSAARSIPLLQKWMNDVKAARTPSRFIIIDAELRQHLAQSLSGLNQLEADAAAGDKPAMASDYVVAVYGADWTGTVVPLILQSQEVRATGYKNIVAIQKHELDLCLTTCTILVSSQAKSCVTNGGAPCLQMFDEMAVYFAMIAGMLVRDAAPQSLGAKDSKLQGDLAAADAVLLRMRLAVAHGDQAGINSGIDQVIRIGGRIDQDAADIANS